MDIQKTLIRATFHADKTLTLLREAFWSTNHVSSLVLCPLISKAAVLRSKIEEFLNAVELNKENEA